MRSWRRRGQGGRRGRGRAGGRPRPSADGRLVLGEGPTVLVLGHADTVWPAGTAANWPFAARGGWLHGPGVGRHEVLPGHGRARAGARRRRPTAGPRPAAAARRPRRGARHGRDAEPHRGGRRGATAVPHAGGRAGRRLGRHGPRRGRGDAGRCHGLRGTSRTAGRRRSALRPLAALVAPMEALSDEPPGTRVSVGVLRGGHGAPDRARARRAARRSARARPPRTPSRSAGDVRRLVREVQPGGA